MLSFPDCIISAIRLSTKNSIMHGRPSPQGDSPQPKYYIYLVTLEFDMPYNLPRRQGIA